MGQIYLENASQGKCTRRCLNVTSLISRKVVKTQGDVMVLLHMYKHNDLNANVIHKMRKNYLDKADADQFQILRR